MNPLKDNKDDSIVRSIQSHTKALNKFIQEASKRDITIKVKIGDRQGYATTYKYLYLDEIAIVKIEQTKIYYPLKE